MDIHTFQILAVAIGLGLLVGLQRERAAAEVAGIRTFPLITVSGTLSGLLAEHFGGWILGAGIASMTALVISASIIKQRKSYDPGLTTEVAGLVMYCLGAYLCIGSMGIAVVLGGLVAVLLQLKDYLHESVRKMGDHDIHAIMRFTAIALVILPLLPDENFGPYSVLNPFDIWRMVVIIVGISLFGYAAYKLFRETAGTLLAGLIGGLISSTATTVSYARRTKGAPEASSLAALAIMLASTVAFLRITLVFTVIAPKQAVALTPPLLVMFLLMSVISALMYFQRSGEATEMPEQENPTELGSAIFFGALYAGILLAVAATRDYLGESGLYLIATISGLTDVDAITLSTGRLVSQTLLEPETGWRLVLTAAISNLAFKAAATAILGDRSLFKRIGVAFGMASVGGLALILAWPA
ncbi:uncharacterized membrane protein (DUF4010 family) [Fluviicoccus keumensis]|uniref:Uncharacterized membrane protein (DUF4010 family) n=1 Tax=Fluviicoccus keumensis TaxID=1435465 RepID=A0A4Q7Z600_9GAMM|nr:MgtC/SapB family protein [Fluviicoccus keumensis]RZU45291.1 uncharacterized membrane protein (DUF4010 family) [Fluviicoccus keumensis]